MHARDTETDPMTSASTDRFTAYDFLAARARIAGYIVGTPLMPFDVGDPRIELRLKLENRQVTGAFKARGATNNIARLTEAERAAGVVATSSGNHGKALAWAAMEAGVKATIVMPANAYPNKIAACRELGATVVLSTDRMQAEVDAAALVAQGLVPIHPYDADGTIEGAGTVGLDIADDWPEVEVVVIPVGGGGLAAGTSLALRRTLGDQVRCLGAEPGGAPSMSLGIEAGAPVVLDAINTEIQGLCPPESGARNIAVCRETLEGVARLSDTAILDAQRVLVQAGEVVEPAGAAAVAAIREGHLEAWLVGRDEDHPLRVVAVISGGNPAPDQLEQVRASIAAEA